MEQELRLRLHSNGKWSIISSSDVNLGYTLENGATVLVVELPSEAYGIRHFLEFVKPSGVTVSTSELLEESDTSGIRYISLRISNGLIDEQGRYLLQYVGRKGSQRVQVYKSDLKALDVTRSINAGLAINDSDPDFISWTTAEIANLKNRCDAIDKTNVDQQDELTNINNRLSYLEKLLSAQTYMGVIFYGKETVGVRVGAAAGLRAGVNGEVNDFDKAPIYKDIEIYHNAAGEKIWKCKSFYVKHIVSGFQDEDDFYEAWYISPSKLDSTWQLHAAFWDKNKADRGYFTLGCYKASFNDNKTKLVTLSGKEPATNISLEEARPLAAANNAHIAELRKADAVNILMMVEFAVRDFQREWLKGVCFGFDIYGSDYSSLQNIGPSNVVRYPVNDILDFTIINGDHDKMNECIKPGRYCRILDDNYGTLLGDAKRQITAVQTKTVYDADNDENIEVLEITYNGSPVAWDGTEPSTEAEDETAYPTLVMFSATTGQCDGLPGSSHEEKNNLDGLRHLSYRGLEDWYGVFYEWVDGEALRYKYLATVPAVEEKNKLMICFDPAKYPNSNSSTQVDGVYRDPSFEGWEEVCDADGNNYMQVAKDLPKYPGLIVNGNATNGDGTDSDSTGYADYVFMHAGKVQKASREHLDSNVFCRGGCYYCEWYAGPFYVDGDYSFDRDGYYGFRLSYDPS